jgi:hypothetical protein
MATGLSWHEKPILLTKKSALIANTKFFKRTPQGLYYAAILMKSQGTGLFTIPTA